MRDLTGIPDDTLDDEQALVKRRSRARALSAIEEALKRLTAPRAARRRNEFAPLPAGPWLAQPHEGNDE